MKRAEWREHWAECSGVGCTLGNNLHPAEICRQYGWGVGTVLYGDEGYGVAYLLITAIGERNIMGRDIKAGSSENLWTLSCRCWLPHPKATP